MSRKSRASKGLQQFQTEADSASDEYAFLMPSLATTPPPEPEVAPVHQEPPPSSEPVIGLKLKEKIEEVPPVSSKIPASVQRKPKMQKLGRVLVEQSRQKPKLKKLGEVLTARRFQKLGAVMGK